MLRSLLHRAVRPAMPLLLASGAFACADVHAATAGGTLVSNRAEIVWIDAGTGEAWRAPSDASSVVVGDVRRFAADGVPEASARAGATIDVPYRVVNTGNVAERYRLSLVEADGDAGALDALAVHHDLNGNGVLDAGEPRVAETLPIEPGASIALVAAAALPATALAGDRHALELRVENATGAIDVVPTTITVFGGAALAIDKRVDVDCAVAIAPGDTARYEVAFANEGDLTAPARSHRIDGRTRDGVLVADRLPEGFRLEPHRAIDHEPADALALVRTTADGDGWTSYARWDGTRPARQVALFVGAGALAPGGEGRFGYALRADGALAPGAAGRTVAGVDLDGDDRDEFASAPPCGTPAGTGGEPDDVVASIAFVTPSAASRREGRLPGFAVAEDFAATGSYPLDGGRDDYDVARDGLYLELRVEALPEGVALGDDGPEGTSLIVTLESLGTGDTLEVALLETAAGSGTFRSIRPIALGTVARGEGRYCPGGDVRPLSAAPDYAASAPACRLLSERDDTLRVLFGDAAAGVELTATVTVDPIAIVFSSADLEPVPGAAVTFLGADGEPVVDPASGRPLASVSDERGVYRVPSLPPGTGYSVSVAPPEGWRFPSEVAPEALAEREVYPSAYGAAGIGGAGGTFAVVAGGATPVADIPLDPPLAGGRLVLAKRALAVETEPGGVVAYALAVSNLGDVPLVDVRVTDRLPFGFALVRRTTRIDGERVADPEGVPGRELEFALGELAPGARLELEYVLEATAGAIDGDGTNVARASARTADGRPLESAESRARVRVSRAGALSDRAALFGKVYVDADCNDLHNDAEWPVGGVRLYLDDGTFAITDENGQYSLYGLAPGTRVVRVDPITVPEGLVFKPIDNANAATGDSRFVALSPGDFHRADFALSCPVANVERVLGEIRERNADIDGTWLLEQAERFDPVEDRLDGLGGERLPDASAADIDGDLSNGVLNGPDAGRTRSDRRVDEAGGAADEDGIGEDGVGADGVGEGGVGEGGAGARTPTAAPRALDPERAAADITAEQARSGTWLHPASDTSLDGRFVAVVRAGVEPTLYVGGEPVPATQIGERIENRRESAQIVAWYGVELAPGPNRVEVRGTDPFGNLRVLAEGDFKHPAAGTRMVLRARTDTLPADGGRSVLPIEIVVLDANDYPARGVHFVTLETSEAWEGGWVEEDLRPDEPGHQVRVDDGRATATLRSSDFTGTLLVRARADDMGASLRVFQIAALRPLFGVGLLELGVVSSDLMGEGFAPEGPDGPLDGDTRAEGRLSMFLKGRVRGDAQLTLSYDSEKDGDTELLRDIDPGAHYPIHGDASVRGYEAQSRSKLYARLEKGKSSVMWGDYVTDVDTDVDDLARDQRVLTGFNARHDAGRARFQLFGAAAETGRRVEEIPGNGTAMLFRLAGAPIVPNSELVERIVRDRENPGLVISAERLSRFGDYTLDSIGGELSFAEPVPSVDEALNPVFVRVSYDRRDGGESYLVGGARGRFELTDSLVAGASYTRDEAPADGGDLAGAWLAWRPRERTSVTLGLARATHADGRAAGNAERLAVEHLWDTDRERRTAFVAARADEGFDAAGSSVGAGRRELRLQHTERLTSTVRAELEASRSESLAVEELRRTYGATFERSLDRWALRAGVRRIHQRDAREEASFTTALAGAERRFEIAGRAASASAEHERDVADASRNRLALGAKLQAHEHVALSARYERQSGILGISALGGGGTTETFALGAESDVLENTRLYSEYRMRGGIGGRDLVTASGVRGAYEPVPGLTLTPAFELVDTIAGDDSGDGAALSIGASDTRNPNVRINAQGEYRSGRRADYVGLRGSYAARLNLDWTALVREDIRRQDAGSGAVDLRHAFTLGLARRPRLDNRHHLLFRYQWKVERGEEEARDRDVHVLSTHQNVQVHPRLVLSGRLAGKRQTTFLSDRRLATSAGLGDVRATWDVDRRWSVEARAGLLATGGDGHSLRRAFGVGLSHVLDRNLVVQLGYNVVGFRDEDLDPEGFDARGIRFGLRYKFDEKAFDWLDGR